MSVLQPFDWDTYLFTARQQEAQKARLEAYKRNWNYYHGVQKRPLSVGTQQPDDNVVINFARLVVDKGVSFLFGKELEFELQEGEVTPEEEYLEKVWQRNRKMTWLTKFGTSGGIYGDPMLKIVPDGMGPGIARLVILEPEIVTLLSDPEDIERIVRYRLEWVSEDQDGKALHYRQDIQLVDDNGGVERWDVVNRVAKGNGIYVPDPNRKDERWPYAWPPILHTQNLPCPGTIYGQADIDEVALQDAINYLASKMQKIIRYHAHPKTIGRGFKATDMQHGEDDLTILPSKDSDISNLEMRSDLSGSMQFMDRLISWLLATARIPRLDPAVVSVGALSGFALKVLYGDLLEKTEVKRRTYGDLLVELNRRLCDLGGFGAEHYVTIHWQDPLPEDEQAEMTRDQFELDNELASHETVATRRGLDYETEKERIAAEREEREAQGGNIGAAVIQQFMNGQPQRARQEPDNDDDTPPNAQPKR